MPTPTLMQTNFALKVMQEADAKMINFVTDTFRRQ
jgi:hypothetical protein